ncbi:MAG: ABC transporter permease subunit, partial [Clostridia bacterium]
MKEKKFTRRFAIAIIFITVFVPFIPLVVWSFSQRWAYPSLIPEFGMRAWEYIFTQKSIINGLFTSIWTSLVVTFVSLVIGLPAAKALGMMKFKGKKFAETLITLPAIVPSLAVIMGLQVIFIKIGLINTHIGVIIVHLIPTMPYMVMYLQSTFEDYQSEYEDQARVLGA